MDELSEKIKSGFPDMGEWAIDLKANCNSAISANVAPMAGAKSGL